MNWVSIAVIIAGAIVLFKGDGWLLTLIGVLMIIGGYVIRWEWIDDGAQRCIASGGIPDRTDHRVYCNKLIIVDRRPQS